jgi:hypothetical protein
MVESYTFGSIIINGQLFENDIIASKEYVQDKWRRKKGHELCIDDIKDVIQHLTPEVIVVGTGKFGILKVLDETKEYLDKKGIELIAERTGRAYQTYNYLLKSKNVIGFFHLTC